MVQRKPTPEEQLLKLIENPNAPGGEAGKKAAVPGSAKPAFSFGKLFGGLAYWKAQRGKSVALENRPFSFDLKWLNRALFAMVLASGIFLMIDLFFFRPGQADFLAQVGTSEPVFPVLNAKTAAEQDLSFFREPLKKRNPFLPPGSQTPPAAQGTDAGAPPAPKNAISDVLQGFKLVGISWGAEPLAMIEEVSTGRTHFLRKGQELNGLKVQEISKEKVKVTYEGQEGELF